MLTSRTPRTKNDLKRRRGTGPGPQGFACPESSKHFWEPVQAAPTIAEMAFLHRHLAPIGKFGISPTRSGSRKKTMAKRQIQERRFKVARENSLLTVQRPLWEVRYHAQGSPDGWRYRCVGLTGSYEAFRQEIAEIEAFFESVPRDFPVAVRLTKNRETAHAWAIARYGDGVVRWKGALRFKDPNFAFEFRMTWT
jgi:hypothetical protein